MLRKTIATLAALVAATAFYCTFPAGPGNIYAQQPAAAQTAPSTSAGAAEADKRLADFMALDGAKLIAGAAEPQNLPQNMKLRLIDYVDCANDRLHPCMSDGYDQTVVPPQREAGLPVAYRRTGGHSGSYFAWRIRVDKPGEPHLLVVEFPDDADRMTAISLSQPPRPVTDDGGDSAAKPSMKMEFGYRTGDLLPLSGESKTGSIIFYPTSAEPAALLVANWHAHNPAALVRVWVYAIESPLPAAFTLEERLHRQAGRFDDLPTVLHHRYGGQPRNIVDHLDWLGLGELGLVALDHDRAFYAGKTFIPGDTILPEIMASLEPSGKHLVAAFDPDARTGIYTLPRRNINLANLSDKAARAALTGFIIGDFVKPYKSSPALGGIMLGRPNGVVGTDLPAGSNYSLLIAELSSAVARKNSSYRLYQGLAAATTNDHSLRESDGYDIIDAWAGSDDALDELLHSHFLRYLQPYGLSPKTGNQATLLMRGCDVDQAAYSRFYGSTTPRHRLLATIGESGAISRGLLPKDRLGGIMLNHLPQWRLMDLKAGRDFWWDYPAMSPHISPVGREALAPLTAALAAGAEPFSVWICGQGSQESLNGPLLRQWMRVYRQLPYRHFARFNSDDAGDGADGAAGDDGTAGAAGDDGTAGPVEVRYYSVSQLHILLANPSPVEATVTVSLNGEGRGKLLSSGKAITDSSFKVTLPPYAIEAVAFEQDAQLRISGVKQSAPALAAVAERRLAEFRRNMEDAAKAGIELPARFGATLSQAAEALQSGNAGNAGDLGRCLALLEPGIIHEPQLRTLLATKRPRAEVLRAARPIAIDGRLDDWEGVRPIVLDRADQLATDKYTANRWRGKDDLAAELYLAWSEDGLHFALKVRDDMPTDDENEFSLIGWSGEFYQSAISRSRYDGAIRLPRTALESEYLVTRRDGNLTIHEGVIGADRLTKGGRLKSGLIIGLNLIVSDSDDRRGMPYAWCKSSMMAWNAMQEGYQALEDAQTCGEIELKK